VSRMSASLLATLAAGGSLAATVLTACGTDSAADDPAAVEEVVEAYLAAVGDGRGRAACEHLTAEAQLGVFDFRLVHAGADHPDQACARIVERNRLRGERALKDVEVTDIEIDGEAATASADGVDVGLAESVVPGDRPPPKPRPTTLS
jgi:hypothetical protein